MPFLPASGRLRRASFARWLAALVLCAALGPVVSGALLQRAAGAVAAECLMHAAHGMACEEGSGAPAGGEGGHCGLCLLNLHPPVLDAPPRLGPLHAAAREGGERVAAAAAALHDRARRWMARRQHAPPG